MFNFDSHILNIFYDNILYLYWHYMNVSIYLSNSLARHLGDILYFDIMINCMCSSVQLSIYFHYMNP